MNAFINILSATLFSIWALNAANIEGDKEVNSLTYSVNRNSIYLNCELEGKLDLTIFENAMESLDKMEYNNEDIVSIIDFSKPSTEKRLFIIDTKKQELLYQTSLKML